MHRTGPLRGEVAPLRVIRGFSQLWDGARIHTDAAVAFAGDQVAWVGRDRDRPDAGDVVDVEGALGLPGLVDCHTHTVFAGSRAGDFVRRLAGESYAQILEAGGGIHATVRATRGERAEVLGSVARARLLGMAAGGVTTVEIKSGYGLEAAAELRMLVAARAAAGPVRVIPTFLAHTVPPDVDRARFIDDVVEVQLPACAALATAVDVYCDRGAYTLAEATRILTAGRALGLGVRVHAEQITHTGIAAVAAGLGAWSADHLEHLDEEGIAAMAAAGTVAVLLPGAMLYLRDPAPPVARLRAEGVPLAVATDFNPGSSPVRDLWTAATLACLGMGLTVEEALGAVTRQAGRAVGRPDLGWLGPAAVADLGVFRPPPGEPADLRVLIQYLGGHRVERLYIGGVDVTREVSTVGP